MNVSGIPASSGLSAAMDSMRTQLARHEAAAERIASGTGDLLDNVVEMKTSQAAMQFSAAVVRASLDMQDSVLDILV